LENNFDKIFQYSLLPSESLFKKELLGDFINICHNTQFNTRIGDNMPFSLYLIELMVFMCDLLAINRVNVADINSNDVVVCNCYAFAFYNSGVGKGRTYNILHDLFKPVREKMKENFETKKIALITAIQLQNLPKNQERQEIKEINKQMTYVNSQSDFTRAGIRNIYDAYLYFDKPIGGLFQYFDEFSDYLVSLKGNTLKNDALSAMYGLYDKGKLGGSALADRKIAEMDFFPVNLLGVSHFVTLIEKNIFNEFVGRLNGGLARRSLFACESQKELDLLKNKSKINHRENPLGFLQENDKPFDYESFNYLQNYLIQIIKNSRINNCLILNEDAKIIYKLYVKECKDRAEKTVDKTLSVEKLNRFWKVLKLSAVFHALNSQLNNNIITCNDILQSIYIVEYFGFHLERFLSIIPDTDTDILFNIFNDKIDTWLTVYDIAKHKYFRKINIGNRYPRQWIIDNMKGVIEYAKYNNCELIREKYKFMLRKVGITADEL